MEGKSGKKREVLEVVDVSFKVSPNVCVEYILPRGTHAH